MANDLKSLKVADATAVFNETSVDFEKSISQSEPPEENDSFELALRSKNEAKSQHYRNSAWFACEVVHLTCITIVLYLLYALLHYKALKGRRQKCRNKRGGEWLENLCIIGIIVSLTRFANNQVLLFTGWTSTTRCSFLLNISIALYFLAIHPVYFFLWVRQRIFYTNRALKHLYSKSVRFCGWVTIVCFVLTTIVSLTLFVVDKKNSASGRVCENSKNLIENLNTEENNNTEKEEQFTQGVFVNIMGGVLGGGIQLSFLALFLYPINDKKLKEMRAHHTRNGSAALIMLIRRSFVLAGACILSDVVVVLLVKAITSKYPDAIFAPLAMYDVNLVINLLCIISTFRRWRAIIFPWFYILPCAKSLNSSRSIAGRHEIFRGTFTTNRASYRNSSLEAAELGLKSCRSRAYRQERRHLKNSKSFHSPMPLPQAVLRTLNENEENFSSAKEPDIESFVRDHNQNFESELHQCSDTALYTLPFQGKQRKRSASLTLVPQDVNSTQLKRSRSNITATLFAKSKLWLIDKKSCY